MANTAAQHAHHDDGQVHAHIAPAPFYWAIFFALVGLTVVTVGVSYVDLGPANTIVAVLVATVKASLVAAFFMHLVHDRLFNFVSFLGAFVFLGIMLVFSNEDIGSRGRLDDAQGTYILPSKGEYAPGGLADRKQVMAPAHGEHGKPEGAKSEGHPSPAPSGKQTPAH
jgi:cytochrome c oxidase subunit 4